MDDLSATVNVYVVHDISQHKYLVVYLKRKRLYMSLCTDALRELSCKSVPAVYTGSDLASISRIAATQTRVVYREIM